MIRAWRAFECVRLHVCACVMNNGIKQIFVREAQVKFKAFVNVWATRGTVPPSGLES